MSKITLTDLVNLENQTAAVSAINANNATIEAAFDNTISRSGTSPNQMQTLLDMNSNTIINLPTPTSSFEPIRLIDVGIINGAGITVSPLPIGGTANQVLAKQSSTNYDVAWKNPTGVITYVDNMVAMRALAQNVTPYVTLNGYYTIGDGGGGDFYWDATNTSTDNQGTIIQPNGSSGSVGRWVRFREDRNVYNVKWFGAKGDGVTSTDGTAILNTVNASGFNGVTIKIPAGQYLSAINCFPFVSTVGTYVGIKVEGSGASNSAYPYAEGTEVIFTSATGSLMSIDGVEGVEISNISLVYNNPAYAGDLIDARQILGGIETNSVHIHDFSISGVSGVATNANSLIRVGNGIKFHLHDGFMQLSKRGFHCAGDQSVNDVDIHDVWFQNFSSIPITMGGNNWNIHDNAVEPLTSGNAGFITGTTRNYGCNVSGNNLADVATGAGTWLDFTGAGLIEGGTICNNLFDRGGTSINLGTSKGVQIFGNYIGGTGTTDNTIIGSSATSVTCLSNYRVSSGGAGVGVMFNGAFPTDDHSIIDNNDAFGIWIGRIRLTNPVPGNSGGFGLDVSGSTGVPIFTAGAATFTATTGTGNVVRATSPTLVTPVLGTPTSGVATNLTGTASGLTAGNVTTNANLTGDVTSVGNATTLTNAPVIAKVLTGYTSGAGTVSSADSILSAIQKLNGNDATNANLTGDVTSVGNATTLTNAPVIAKVLTGYSAAVGTIASTDSILQAFNKVGGLVDNAGWTSYTPTVTSQTGTITAYTATGLYKIIGKTMHVQCSVTVSTVGTASGALFFTPPGGVTLSGNQALSATQNAGTANGGIVNTTGFGQFFVLVPATGTIIATAYYIGGTIPIA